MFGKFRESGDLVSPCTILYRALKYTLIEWRQHWDHLWTILGPPYDHFETTFGPFCDHFRPYWDHIRTILGPPWNHLQAILVYFWDHLGTILWPPVVLSSCPIVGFSFTELSRSLQIRTRQKWSYEEDGPITWVSQKRCRMKCGWKFYCNRILTSTFAWNLYPLLFSSYPSHNIHTSLFKLRMETVTLRTARTCCTISNSCSRSTRWV